MFSISGVGGQTTISADYNGMNRLRLAVYNHVRTNVWLHKFCSNMQTFLKFGINMQNSL